MLVGYARVSTQELETHAQTDALRQAGVGFVFVEQRSGGSASKRPVLEEMLATIRPGDTVVVYKLDRIARSLKDLRIIIERIEVAGAQFRSLTPSRQAQQEDDM
ncbi:DNA invertase Pin-like site-specific DNA recombinase [Cupriavidus metallidurans]|nr:recombinase family protein [Cupriavidus metallidurans]